MSDVAIQAVELSKRYRIGAKPRYKTLRDVLSETAREPFRAFRRDPGNSENMFWALKDVSFELKRGDAVGIIGRNGAGKSTLLKLLSRVTEPTAGRARFRGRLGSLLEVGTGFHPELTGRENIFLNAAILGMKKEEVVRKFDGIVDFAEIEQFLDTPVKHYSSGMYVRLAFAVAAHLEPDILLVDEVLAVGDAAFQKKCLGKMGEVAREGRTVLFVSHNLGAVHALTRSCLYLNSGKLLCHDKTEIVVQRYLNEGDPTGEGSLDRYRRNARSNSPVRLTKIQTAQRVEIREDFCITIEVASEQDIRDALATVVIKNSRGERVALAFSWDAGVFVSLRKGSSVIHLKMRNLPLPPGRYYCDAGLNQSTMTGSYDLIQDYPIFEVVNNGEIVHWLDRPWAAVHWQDLEWNIESS
jgi:lipopolysaccharide transport system ATP-binding protein